MEGLWKNDKKLNKRREKSQEVMTKKMWKVIYY